MDELLTMSVVEMARRIREGELSPTEALEAHIKRIEEVNPQINALVVPRLDEARKEARAAEDRLGQGGDLPPLLGVPCTIKDTYAMEGLPWAGGVWVRRDLKPDFNATVVDRLKEAGAVIMGKTNVPEAAVWIESYNYVYGRTRNPYDLSRGVGGSSGGEGAIIAAAASPFGIGSDMGGSIRFPAAFNGVAGHKPTAGLVPGTGHFPEFKGEVMPYCVYGPLARRVDDLAYVLPIIAGPDDKDPIVEKREIKPIDSVDLSKVRVHFHDYNGQVRCGDEVRRAVSMAAGALAGEAASVDYWVPEGLEFSVDVWSAGMAQAPEPYIKNFEVDEPVSLGRELINFITRKGKITLPAMGTMLVEGPQKRLLAARNRHLLDVAEDLRARLDDKLGDDGVIVCPVFPVPAPKHYGPWRHIFGMGYSGIYNIMHYPATVLPIFHRPDGVPVSIQVVATKWNDHLTLAVARHLEQIFGGWKPPEKV